MQCTRVACIYYIQFHTTCSVTPDISQNDMLKAYINMLPQSIKMQQLTGIEESTVEL